MSGDRQVDTCQQAVLRGGLLASVASVGILGAASKKQPCYAWAGGGHVTPSRELRGNLGLPCGNQILKSGV